MDWEIDLARDTLNTHLSGLMRAACDDSQATALLTELSSGHEGYIEIVSGHPYAMIADTLDRAAAEAAVLHEAGHWLLGHEEEPERSKYVAARVVDEATGSRTRGPWERQADLKAIELVNAPHVASLLTGTAAEVAHYLEQDAAQYS